jgi:hypothetical protein
LFCINYVLFFPDAHDMIAFFAEEAAGVMVSVLSLAWLSLVNWRVPEPYMVRLFSFFLWPILVFCI